MSRARQKSKNFNVTSKDQQRKASIDLSTCSADEYCIEKKLMISKVLVYMYKPCDFIFNYAD